MGLSILPMGAWTDGLRKAPSYPGLPEMPIFAIVLVTDENKPNDTRDLFVRYLEGELDNLKRATSV